MNLLNLLNILCLLSISRISNRTSSTGTTILAIKTDDAAAVRSITDVTTTTTTTTAQTLFITTTATETVSKTAHPVTSAKGSSVTSKKKAASAAILSSPVLNVVKSTTTTPTSTSTSSTADNNDFMEKLMHDHRQYCGRKGICSGSRYDRCHRCEPCQCDDICSLYDDCCPDVMSVRANVTGSRSQRLPRQCVSDVSRMYRDRDDTNVTIRDEKRYVMVTSCPSEKTSQLCADSVALPPVTSAEDNVTFLNKVCAECNNVTEYVRWSVKIDCTEQRNFSLYQSKSQIVKEALNDEACIVYYHPPNGINARPCYYDDTLISTCNITGLWTRYDAFTEKACAAFSTVKIVNGLSYRNPFCFLCNSDNLRKLLFKCRRRSNGKPLAFSALLDFGEIFRPSEKDLAVKCDEGHVYDKEKDKCRAVTCSPGKHLVNMECKTIFTMSKGLGYEIYFGVVSRDVIPLADYDDLLHWLPRRLEAFITYEWCDSEIQVRDIVVSYNTTVRNGTCSQETQNFGLYARLFTVQDVNQVQFEERLLSLKRVNFNLTTESRQFALETYPSSEMSPKGRFTKRTGFRNLSSCVISVSLNLSLFDSEGLMQTNQMYYIPVSNLLECPQIELDPGEFAVDADNRLNLRWLNHSLGEDDYEETERGTVKICLKYFKTEGLQARKDDDILVLVSMICTVLSLACLFLTFATFCLFKQLRQIPGQNNMNLCLTLFAAQLLYLVGSGQTSVKGVCETLGIFIHYFWLAAFCSMAVCSFHMFSVFTTLRSRADSSDRKLKFLQYTIFVYGVPIIVVMVTLIIHLIISKGKEIGYGGNVCYLSSPAAVGLAFGVPVAAAVVVNGVFFFMTVRSIRLSPKLAKNKEDEQQIFVYVKLSTLTGITWIIGFVAIGTQIRAIEYVFVVINASQGVFLFLSFVCNRRIFKMFSQCCRGDERKGRNFNYTKDSDSKSQTRTTLFSVSNPEVAAD